MTERNLRFGAFVSPIHAPHQNPTLAIHRDVELFRLLDQLGFDEAWMGEHHSTGWEFVGSPEVFLAFVASQTRRIRLGTGVVSLPYHHPYHVAERVVLLDHLTRGRVLFGVGPGALPYDAVQFGIDPLQLRPRMEESLDAILALLRGERVTRHADWFTLDDALLQLLPYSGRDLEIAVTSSYSPAGARLAGKYGISLLSLNATQPEGVAVLRGHWDVAEEQAGLHGTTVDRSNWRLTGPMFVAESEAEARAAVASGLPDWVHYMTNVTALATVSSDDTLDTTIDRLIESGFAVIGTPEQAIAQLERLYEASGGFGAFLIWTNDWASREDTFRSYELFARKVVPAFQPGSRRLIEAEEYARANRPDLLARTRAASAKATDDYAAERAARAGATE
jgi:limonene 1,2-monooxygenase